MIKIYFNLQAFMAFIKIMDLHQVKRIEIEVIKTKISSIDY